MDVYQAALSKWGLDLQLRQLAEECCELSVEALHYAKRKNNFDKLAEEIVDVEIMLEQMRLVVDPITWDRIKQTKLLKLQKALSIEPRIPEVANE